MPADSRTIVVTVDDEVMSLPPMDIQALPCEPILAAVGNHRANGMTANAAAPANPAAMIIHSDPCTPMPAMDIDIATGATAEVTCLADVHHPSLLPYPLRPNSSSGRVPLTMLVRPEPNPMQTAKTTAPANHGVVESRITTPVGISTVAMTASQA